MADDDLVMQGVKISSAMVETWYFPVIFQFWYQTSFECDVMQINEIYSDPFGVQWNQVYLMCFQLQVNFYHYFNQ